MQYFICIERKPAWRDNENHSRNAEIPCRHRAQGRACDDAQKAGAFETNQQAAASGSTEGGGMKSDIRLVSEWMEPTSTIPTTKGEITAAAKAELKNMVRK